MNQTNKTRQRIGIYGGSFDPFHQGHYEIIRVALESLPLETLWLLPNFRNPMKSQSMFSAEIRLRMCEIVVQEWQKQGYDVRVCDYEIKSHHAIFTIQSIQYFQSILRLESKIFFLLGEDSFNTLPLWKDSQKLCEMLDFVVIKRQGSFLDKSLSPHRIPIYQHCCIDSDLASLSSTHLRQLFEDGHKQEAFAKIPACLHSLLEQYFAHQKA